MPRKINSSSFSSSSSQQPRTPPNKKNKSSQGGGKKKLNTSQRKKADRTIKVWINNRQISFKYSFLKQIKKLQMISTNLVGKLPFSRLVREVTQQYGNFQYTSEALTAIQMSAELYLTQLFECSNKCAYHAKRVTIKPVDMDLVFDLRGCADPGHRRKY